ncbi:MAG: bifunctional glutamate N-acetyltransferase/amino-acid acetyltransferase ArgJ, partial [Pseudomonadota bacterium]
GTTCAGVFTRSATASDDVEWCRTALAESAGTARVLIANSGNSNAFTGPDGRLKNEATLKALTDALGVAPSECYIAATGVIGEALPNPNYVGEIVPELKQALSDPNWEDCARAFMTTDTFPKGSGLEFTIEGTPIRIAGIAKGSGMIAPNMATMLAFVFTDASISAPLLDQLVRRAVEPSFNAITVDGDTSTSDTLIVFATGKAGGSQIKDEADPRCADILEGLKTVCLDLAHQIVRDGEGATKFVTIDVSGTDTDADAKCIAASVANSPLVKTALAANDANWGRVVMAIGNAGVPLDQSQLSIWFGDVLLAEGGRRAPTYSEEAATEAVSADNLLIRIKLGSGTGTSRIYTCDLTHGYVDINGAYRT